MSYYQGDFYQGDFWGKVGGFFKKAAGVATSFFPGVGGPVSTAIQKIGGPGQRIIQRGTAAIAKHPVLTAAGAAGTIGLAGAGVGRMGSRMGSAAVGPMSGYHIEKRGKRAGQLIKNRRMRVTNVRALRRAIRRCTGFAHLAKRVLRFTSPRPPRGRAVFKHHKKKRVV